MITGYNTDIEFNGRIYHVQTEDRGIKNPIIESLIYTGGEILTGRKTPYIDLIQTGACSEAEVQKRVEAQHKSLIREIQSGKFEKGSPRPFGHKIVTNRTFDEVVLGFLNDCVELEQIELNVSGPEFFHEGQRQDLTLNVIEGNTQRPVCGATVVVQLVASGAQPQRLFSAPTDAQGRVQLVVEIPAFGGSNAAIVCQADALGRTAEVRRTVRKRQSSSAQHA